MIQENRNGTCHKKSHQEKDHSKPIIHHGIILEVLLIQCQGRLNVVDIPVITLDDTVKGRTRWYIERGIIGIFLSGSDFGILGPGEIQSRYVAQITIAQGGRLIASGQNTSCVNKVAFVGVATDLDTHQNDASSESQ